MAAPSVPVTREISGVDAVKTGGIWRIRRGKDGSPPRENEGETLHVEGIDVICIDSVKELLGMMLLGAGSAAGQRAPRMGQAEMLPLAAQGEQAVPAVTSGVHSQVECT